MEFRRLWDGTLAKTYPNLLTKGEKRAVNILENTCEFIKDKYQVGLLWKKDNPVLPYNRNVALKRVENLEKKFSKDQLLAKRYSETVISAKVMRPKSKTSNAHNVITLPFTYFTTESLININQIN